MQCGLWEIGCKAIYLQGKQDLVRTFWVSWEAGLKTKQNSIWLIMGGSEL